MATRVADKNTDRETTIRVSLSLSPKDYQSLKLLASMGYLGYTKHTSVASGILKGFLQSVKWVDLDSREDERRNLMETYKVDD